MRYSLPEELIDVDPFLRPVVHMAPFDGKHSYPRHRAPRDEEAILARCALRLVGSNAPTALTRNGREALNWALAATVKSREDLVAIVTPSNCGYVSSCVTKEIEKFCRWKFGPVEEADIVVLIHEFGRFVELPEAFRRTSKPVIEDCAYAMVDRSFAPIYGRQGDYVVYSLAKAFPVQFGGLLIARNGRDLPLRASSLSQQGRDYLLHSLDRLIEKLPAYNKARASVYGRMRDAARERGFSEILPAQGAELAHAFLVAMDTSSEAQDVKLYMNSQGVESSFFHGGGGYFMPCHQSIDAAEIAYMFAHLRRAVDRQAPTA